MKFTKISVILFLLIVLIGAVSATEEITNDTMEHDDKTPSIGLQSTQSDEYTVNEIHTFTDFSKDMNESVDVMDIQYDYKFNNETDSGHILINRSNFIIEGNNHVLDGSNQTNIFAIVGSNITINNLIFTNGNCKLGGLLEFVGGGAILSWEGASITLNNVTFINNAANYCGGDILNLGQLNCLDCNFVDSYSVKGNSIYSQAGSVNLERCTFTSKYSSVWATVFAPDSEVFVNDCLFDNISASYAPAIYVSEANVRINNTKFNNLKAYKTAGAVGIKKCEFTIIENCLFINTSSVKNGGALYIDTVGDGVVEYDPIVYVINSTFVNTSSSFGGAFIQLSGNLTLWDSSFTNCSSNYDGGAVYTSQVDVDIINCKFNSNKVASHDNYPTYGGAIYCDYATLNLNNSEFNSNEAPFGSAIFIYDSEYHLDNITFYNNGNAINTYFDDESSTIGKIYGNDDISQDDLNNTFYPSLIVGEGLAQNLTPNIINLTLLPTKFDLRDIGWITPVRDQGMMGSCWTFGALDALESALVKNTGISYYLSENNVQDALLLYSRYGLGDLESGFETEAAAYILNWFGVFPQEYDSYDELGKISPLIHANQTIHIQDYVLINRNTSNPGDSLLKEAILKYGVLAILYDATLDTLEDYNFYSNSTIPDHAVGLVGWDDNYPKENFLNQPPGDGAWIIKNSWGTEWGEEGYGYVSYYDTSLAPTNQPYYQAVGYIIENTCHYNKNYQYDFSGINDFMTYDEGDELYGSPITNANVFISEDDDLLAAVGTYFNQSGLDYTVEIAVNDVIVYTQNGISPYRGYHTIKLNKYVPIKKGDKFTIYVTSTALGFSVPVRVHYEDGVSFTNFNGTWTDFYKTYGQIACIKAYTLKDDAVMTGNKNIAVDYDGGSYFSVKVATADGHVVVGDSVKFTIDGKTYPVKTDANGIAKIKISQIPKKYTITTTYKGKSVKNTVTVKQVLKTSKVTVKKTAKKFTLKATLKINGKLVKGKMITFKFNGKTYKVKTNSKGIAQKTLNKNIIKKLKKSKTYTVKVTYLKDTIKTTVKVK